MHGAADNFQLLLVGERGEVDGVTGNTDRQLRVLFRMIHRIEQGLSKNDIDIDVVTAVGEITVEQMIVYCSSSDLPSVVGRMEKV